MKVSGAFSLGLWGLRVMIRHFLQWDILTWRKLHLDKGKQVGLSGGRWWVPEFMFLKKPRVISAGIGEETSFEETLLEQCQAQIIACDPTPRAILHGRHLQETWPDVEFLSYGLWDEDGTQLFHAPKNPEHISHSLVALQGQAPAFRAACVKWQTLLKVKGWEKVDILKMDIEGAEHRVIADVLSSEVLPRVICLEFDEIQTPLDRDWKQRILQTIDDLEMSGYRLFGIHHKANYTFVLHEK